MKITSKIIYLILPLGLFQQVYGQKNSNLKKRQMEKLDINKLNRFKAENKMEDTLSDGSMVSYFENPADIQEITKGPMFNYRTIKHFFKSNLSLKREEHFFSGMPIGKLQEYNNSGKLIKELDYENIFKFSLNDVSDFIRRSYNINIFQDSTVEIQRVFGNGRTPYYDINIYSGLHIHVIFLNGITGEIISEGDTAITN